MDFFALKTICLCFRINNPTGGSNTKLMRRGHDKGHANTAIDGSGGVSNLTFKVTTGGVGEYKVI